MAVPIVTAILGGRAYDSSDSPRRLLSLALVGSGVALALASYPMFWTAVGSSVLGGVVSGLGYAVAFAGAKDLNRAGERYDGLAVAWVNGISLTGSFLTPLLYSFLAVSSNYSIAWLGCSLVSFGFLIPLLLMTRRFRA